MNREKLKQLYQKVLEKAGETGEEKALCGAIEAYFNETERLWQPDGNGFLPPITVQDKERIVERYDAIAEALDKFIEKEEQYDPELVKAVNKFAKKSSWNFNILWRYEPAQGIKSAATLAEENRTPKLEVHRELKTVEGAHHLRQVIAARNNQGQVYEGVFTPEEYSPSPTAAVKDGLQKIANKIQNQELKTFLTGLLEKIKQSMPKKVKFNHSDDWDNKDRAAVYHLMVNCCPCGKKHKNWVVGKDGHMELASTTYDPRTVDSVAEGLAQLSNGVFTKEILLKQAREPLKEIAKLLDDQKEPPDRKYSDGSRMDSRSTLMSIMADQLGISYVVARAMPMTIIRDGKEYHGTFMMKADGVELVTSTEAYAECDVHCVTDLKKGKESGPLSGLDADLMDHICHGYDRQGWKNNTLKFDEDGKWSGMQLFDNDDLRLLCKPSVLPYIVKSRAECVLHTKPTRTKFAIWCCEVSKWERTAVAKTVESLKSRITSGGITQIPDEDLYRYFQLDLSQEKAKEQIDKIKQLGPIIRCLYETDVFGRIKKEKINPHILHTAQCKLPVTEIIGNDSRATAEGLEILTEQLKEYDKLLDDNTELLRSSSNYRAMQDALQNLHQYQKGLAQRLREAKCAMANNPNTHTLDLKAVVTPADLLQIEELNRKIERSAWKYLYGKFGTEEELAKLKGQDQKERAKLETEIRKRISAYIKSKGANFAFEEYTKGRINAALQIVKLAQKGQEIGAEMKTASINTAQARENLYFRSGKDMKIVRAAEKGVGLPAASGTLKEVSVQQFTTSTPIPVQRRAASSKNRKEQSSFFICGS